MEITEKKFKVVDEEEEFGLAQYNVQDITELEDGTMFGTFISKFEMNALLPYFEYDDNGKIMSCITENSDDVCEYYDLGDGILSGGEPIPLIFKKVSGNIAQELLSGELFIVATSIKKVDGIDSLERKIDDFQKDVETYSKNNIFILTRGFYDKDNTTLTNDFLETDDKEINGIFAVTDKFKSLYSEKTLPEKDELISVLRSIKNQGQLRFKEKLQEYVSEVQGIAQTENEIYDFENTNHSSKKM